MVNKKSIHILGCIGLAAAGFAPTPADAEILPVGEVTCPWSIDVSDSNGQQIQRFAAGPDSIPVPAHGHFRVWSQYRQPGYSYVLLIDPRTDDFKLLLPINGWYDLPAGQNLMVVTLVGADEPQTWIERKGGGGTRGLSDTIRPLNGEPVRALRVHGGCDVTLVVGPA